jgi:GNAT superfamily N-acetyltransferase
MPLVVRPARAEDLDRANKLVVGSMNDLSVRHGFGPMASVRPPVFLQFSLRDDPDGLWIAEDAGEILGFAFSWVCGDLWFLAQLFVAPNLQGRGIGRELLQWTWQHAEKAGATNKALITFTFNTVSQGLYIRHGLMPRCAIYNLTGARDLLVSRLQGERLRSEPLEGTASHLQLLVAIDAAALGVSRAKHHRYLIDGGTRGVLLHAGDACVGYAYIADGNIEPLAVTRRDLLGAAFGTALALAAESEPAQVSAFIPGPCEAALSIAVACGMRITLPMILMSIRDFGDWAMYLPRNPGFM